MSIPDAITGLTKLRKLPFVTYFLYMNWAAFVNIYVSYNCYLLYAITIFCTRFNIEYGSYLL